MESAGASLEIIVLTLGALAAVLYAWWLSSQETRRNRRLVAWLRQHYAGRWAELPWLSRKINLVGGIEYLRRNGLSEDAEFMALYRETKRGRAMQLAALVAGMVLVAAILLGVRYLGWSW